MLFDFLFSFYFQFLKFWGPGSPLGKFSMGYTPSPRNGLCNCLLGMAFAVGHQSNFDYLSVRNDSLFAFKTDSQNPCFKSQALGHVLIISDLER